MVNSTDDDRLPGENCFDKSTLHLAFNITDISPDMNEHPEPPKREMAKVTEERIRHEPNSFLRDHELYIWPNGGYEESRLMNVQRHTYSRGRIRKPSVSKPRLMEWVDMV